MSGGDSNVVTSPIARPLPLNGGGAIRSSQFEASDDVVEFCDRHLIKDDVVATLALARQHFSVLGGPRYEIIDDLESQQCYLAIHVSAAGSPAELFEQSESFIDAFVAKIAPLRQHHISLVYHSASA